MKQERKEIKEKRKNQKTIQITNRFFRKYRTPDGGYDYNKLIARAKGIAELFDRTSLADRRVWYARKKMSLREKQRFLDDCKKIRNCNSRLLIQPTLNVVYVWEAGE